LRTLISYIILYLILLLSVFIVYNYHKSNNKTDFKVGQCVTTNKTWEGLVEIKKITGVYAYRYKYAILNGKEFTGTFIMKKNVFNKIHSLTNCP